jgi:hypothetical protein
MTATTAIDLKKEWEKYYVQFTKDIYAHEKSIAEIL